MAREINTSMGTESQSQSDCENVTSEEFGKKKKKFFGGLGCTIGCKIEGFCQCFVNPVKKGF